MAKPDNRKDNVARIQNNIDNTIANYRETKDKIKLVDDPTQKRELEAKNERREQSLESMKEEIKDEAMARKNNYK
jgi:small acid-soluble spore protein (thioredoxin-like protein)